ncbi:MAG: T9SS type A sorting domain-containing protein [Bacteroidetes bacterium]|nr:T9SS type A sorting domain-containing protein [Bacteroidota bacterium]
MKNRYLILASCFYFLLQSLSSQAQITIASGDLPAANDTFRVSIGQAFTGMDPALTGANYTWDYSQLTSASQTTDTFVSILSTGLYAFAFFGSSYALKSNTAPVNLGALTIDYQYDFFKKTSSSYVETGMGANLNGFPLPIVFNPKDTIYRLPLHYNNTGICSSAFAVTVPSLGYYGGHKTRIDTVDGWGTLTTPFGTFSALRIKSMISETDSIHIDTFNIGFNIPRPVVTEYKWLGNGQGMPILQINTNGAFVNQIIYLDSVHVSPLAVLPVKNEREDFALYPNPSSGNFFIRFNLDKNVDVSVEVLNLLGESIFSNHYKNRPPGENFLWIDLPGKNISAGTYLVKLKAGERNYQKQLVVAE